MTDLRVRGAGGAGPVLVLLHGTDDPAASGDVWERWRPMLAERWPGRWVAPDLPGYGGSPPSGVRPSPGGMAARVAELLDPADRIVVLGHALGGVVGLALATGWFGVPVHAVVALGSPVGPTDLTGLLAAVSARVVLVRGEQDPTVSADQLDELHPSAVSLAGLGHDAHVQDPDAVFRLVEPFAG